jgi:hypothetical protein
MLYWTYGFISPAELLKSVYLEAARSFPLLAEGARSPPPAIQLVRDGYRCT